VRAYGIEGMSEEVVHQGSELRMNFDSCGFQNPTTFFSWLVVLRFLKTTAVTFSLDNPPAYLTNVSNKGVGIV
jgi:hypothetical protein